MELKHLIQKATINAEAKGFREAYQEIDALISKHGTEKMRKDLFNMFLCQEQLGIIREITEGTEALRNRKRINSIDSVDAILFLADDEIFKQAFEEKIKDTFEDENSDVFLRAGSLIGITTNPDDQEKLIQMKLRYNLLREGERYGKEF